MTTHIPTYHIGQWADHLQMSTPSNTGDPAQDAANDEANAYLRHTIGEYHMWTPSENPQPGDVCFVVMRQAKMRQPHPNWQRLPHVLKRTTIAEHHQKHLNGHAKAAFDAARQADGSYVFGKLVIASDHDMVDMATALHEIMPVFEP